MTINLLQLQITLGETFQYKNLPEEIREGMITLYNNNIPKEFQSGFDSIITPLYSHSGIKISEGWDRIVVGEYGAFFEIDKLDICDANLICQPGQEWRYNPYYSRCKYHWLTTQNLDVKVYEQTGEVIYADYKIGKYYVSPYEVTTNPKGNLNEKSS